MGHHHRESEADERGQRALRPAGSQEKNREEKQQKEENEKKKNEILGDAAPETALPAHVSEG